MIWIAISIVLIGSLVFFRWRLRKLRKVFCFDEPCKAAADTIQSATAAIQHEHTRLSRDPDSESKLSPLRNGQVAIKSVAFMALLLVVFLAGGEIRERTFREGVMPDVGHKQSKPADKTLAAGVAVDGTIRGRQASGQFETKLAELRTAPTLATVSWFDRLPPSAEHRAEVLAALKPLRESENKSIRLVANEAVKRWE